MIRKNSSQVLRFFLTCFFLNPRKNKENMKTIVLFLFLSLLTTLSITQLLHTYAVSNIVNSTAANQSEEIEVSDFSAETTELTQYENQLKESRNQVLFEENKGQVKDQHWQPRPDVLYYGQTEGIDFHIRNNGISYQLNRIDSWKDEDDLMDELAKENSEKHQVPDQTTTYRVDINWIKAQIPQVEVQGSQPGYNNYYNVPDGLEPALYVKQYEKLTLKNLWPGVDIEYYNRNGHLESDWIVQRAEDYKQIAFEVKGAELRIEYGILIMKTPLGEIAEGKLKTFQNNREITSYWKLNGNIVSLEIENFNPAEPIRIDPPVRIWGTYYGGAGSESGRSCTVDGSGNLYMVGQTLSTNAIATTGAHQSILAGGFDADAFLVKFDNNSVRQWGTYYGGNAHENAFSCAVYENEYVYLAGLTRSANNISTAGAHQTAYAGIQDGFLVKFNNNGIRIWGTYYGGELSDGAHSCDLDGNGNVYLSGHSRSTNNIATFGAHQSTQAGGFNTDAFVVKFNNNGVRQWGTYYGGSSTEESSSCAVNSNGDVYLAGRARSTNNISTLGAHQDSYGGGNWDAFLVKFNTNGVRQWGTYYGGIGADWFWSCAISESGDVYLTGGTYSSNNIATLGAHQDTYESNGDAFLIKFNSDGVRHWGTYYGGNGEDWGRSCTVDGNQNVYIAGYTASNNNIATVGSHQLTYGGGDNDGFLAKFNSAGVCQWGTYYGGNEIDLGYSCAADNFGGVYLVGRTASISNIASSGSHQNTYGGGDSDAFIVRFYEDCILTLSSGAGTNIQEPCINTSITDITYIGNAASCATVNGLPPGLNYNIDGDTLTISGAPSQVDTFTYNIVFSSCCDTLSHSGTITVDPSIPITLTSPSNTVNQTVCINEPITNITYNTTAATGATFSGFPIGVSGSFSPISGEINIIGTPSEVGSFNYTISLTGGCGIIEEIGTITVNPNPTISVSNDGPVCLGDEVNFTASGGTSYTWTGPGGFSNGNQNFSLGSAVPAHEGVYEVTVTDENGCSTTDQTTFSLIPSPVLTISAENVSCNGENDGEANVIATGSGPFTYSWNPGGFSSAEVADLSPDTYTITVTDGNGCITIETLSIEEPDAIDLTFFTTDTDCDNNNGEATVNAIGGVGGFSYLWSPENQTSSSITNVAAGIYQVTVTDASGCSTTGSVTINYANAPTLSVDQVNHLTCNGSGDGSATISATGGTAPYSYSWSPTGGNATTAESLSADTYTVTVADDDGCPAFIEVTINEPAMIVIDSEVTDALCGNFNGTIDLSVSGGTGNYSYLWTPLGLSGNSLNELAPGNYSVVLSDANGCEQTASYTVVVTGNIVLSVAPQVVTIVAGDNIQLQASVGAGVTNEAYTWTPPEGLNCTICPDPIASPSETTTYTVTVTTDDGCLSSDTVHVIVEYPCTEVFIPTIFSPNGDNLNDFVCVEGSCIQDLDFRIFNRWGEAVFQTKDQAECWDGKQNGELLNTGVFAFKAIIITNDGKEIEKSGSLTLVK